MNHPHATQERTLESGTLRIRFFWQHDRFAHEVSRLVDGSWQPALVSAEGSPADDWPTSPPLQSLHIEERDDGRTLALLVGMAGKSHWSASVEIDDGQRCVVFDVACRVRGGDVGWLGSTYQPTDANQCGEIRIDLTHRYGPTVLEQVSGETRVVAQMNHDENPQTVRWDYRLCV